MPDLQETAQQFAQDLKDQNIAGLMMAFTPEGLPRAMTLQAQRMAAGPQAPVTGFDVALLGVDGGDEVVDITMRNDNGSVVMTTRWKDVAGAWKVDDIGIKE